MGRSPIVYVLAGALLYFGFLKFRGVIDGMPWAPMAVQRGPRAAVA